MTLFTVGGTVYLALSSSSGSSILMIFDSTNGLFTLVQSSPPVPLADVYHLFGFESQGMQFLVATSRSPTAKSLSQVVIYRNDTLGCRNTSNCSTTWNVQQRFLVSGRASASEVLRASVFLFYLYLTSALVKGERK